VGVCQQHGLAPGSLAVGLAVANDLDASADFDALCYEDGATGNLLLRGHVAIRWARSEGPHQAFKQACAAGMPLAADIVLLQAGSC